jgi:hypothetical protein
VADAVKISRFDRGVVIAGADGEERPPAEDAGYEVAVKVTSPVRLDQLAVELSDRCKVPAAEVALSAVGDPSTASAEEPATVVATSEAISSKTLLDAARAHRPDASWSAETAPTLESVARKARDGEDLSQAEQQLALRHLLGKLAE